MCRVIVPFVEHIFVVQCSQVDMNIIIIIIIVSEFIFCSI